MAEPSGDHRLTAADSTPLPFQGTSLSESIPQWDEPVSPPPGSPNVVLIVLDDVGFGQLSSYGSDIQTPNIDALAANGLQLTGFHTTALCSPSRSCLLTGRNHHSNGMASITRHSAGYPGYVARVPRENGFISEILKARGYHTFAVGKWHLTPVEEWHAGGPFDSWPLGRGFERYFGFPAQTNQWVPQLVQDNSFIPTPEFDGRHLTERLADQAINYLHDIRTTASTRPFFLYFCPGAGHAPHHVPSRYVDMYRGKFDDGWDAARDRILARQKEKGLMPESVTLPERNPDVEAWSDLSDDERRLFARMQEVYAGFITHTDEQIGRIVECIRELGELDNTLLIVVSDNGASGEGGRRGTVNLFRVLNLVPETTESALEQVDELGSENTYNHYPIGWTMAGNTPFKMMKRYVYEGGVADPCVIHWPSRLPNPGLRTQYHHAIDVTPTLLECLGIEAPESIGGVAQTPIQGVSMGYIFDEPGAKTRKRVQYYEMFGHRGIWYDGWKLVSNHEPGAATGYFDDDKWALYHTDVDPNELHDLSEQHPDIARRLEARWWIEAGKYNVLPLDDRREVRGSGRPSPLRDRKHFSFYAGAAAVPQWSAVRLFNRSYDISAQVNVPPGGVEGVIFSQGGRFGGHALFVLDRRLMYVHNFLGLAEYSVEAESPLPEGEVSLRFSLEKTGDNCGTGVLWVNDVEVARADIPRTVPIRFDAEGVVTVGRAEGFPVTSRYRTPFTFTGSMSRVDIDVHGEAASLSAAAQVAGLAEQ